jgi:hypothetical protein
MHTLLAKGEGVSSTRRMIANASIQPQPPNGAPRPKLKPHSFTIAEEDLRFLRDHARSIGLSSDSQLVRELIALERRTGRLAAAISRRARDAKRKNNRKQIK